MYALFCNILIIRCFFGCLGGCSANVKIWLAVFAWAHHADFIFFLCPLWFGRLTNQAQCNGAEAKEKNEVTLRHFGYRSVTRKHRVPKWVPCFVETVHAPSNSQIINKISQTEHAPSLQAKLYVMSCGQKSIKKESNRSNSTFCLICCYLSDFSRSDFSDFFRCFGSAQQPKYTTTH